MSGSLADIADSGDRRRILEGLRQKLAEAIDGGPEPKDLAALCLRLERVTAELEELGPAKPSDLTWEERLAARRSSGKAANA